MSMDGRDRAVELTVPAEREMMIVVRLTTAGVLARSGLTVDAVDDVKMAAEEACNCLIRSSGCASLRASYWMQDGFFNMLAQSCQCACQCASRVTADEIDVIRCVLMSMVDDVHLTYGADTLREVLLRKRLPE